MADVTRKPEWLKVQLNTNNNYKFVKSQIKDKRLTTVCEEARCPNIHECWGEHRTATFMILGDTCTRRCRFCSVKTGLPKSLDLEEPARVAESVREMQLKHVVITMVNRDELPDGGGGVMAQTVRAIRQQAPGCSVEVLSSDLMGDFDSIKIMQESKPDIMSHNLETTRRLTPRVRSRSSYDRSLYFLRAAKEIDPETVTKSSMMLGLGETRDEVLEAMDDLLENNVSIMNLGQYLQPTRNHLKVQKYWTPDEFAELRERALEKGFEHCEAGPLVRSSYHAGEQFQGFKRRSDVAAEAAGAGQAAGSPGGAGAGSKGGAAAGHGTAERGSAQAGQAAASAENGDGRPRSSYEEYRRKVHPLYQSLEE
jgi:lipoic acid synthetase